MESYTAEVVFLACFVIFVLEKKNCNIKQLSFFEAFDPRVSSWFSYYNGGGGDK